jgi:hypothetical protein
LTEPFKRWWSVTYRGTAEMVVWVKAESAEDAKAAAENGNYEEATQIEWAENKRYTMRANLAPDYQPGDAP